MGEVTSMGKVKPQYFVPGFENGQHDGGIGLGSRMRLHVDPFRVKQFFCPIAGEIFDLIHHFTSSIIPLSREALCVFVGQHGAHGFHYLGGGEILGGDQFDPRFLSYEFLVDQVKNGLVSFHRIELKMKGKNKLSA